MIGSEYANGMAAYNKWQNDNLFGAADRLTDEQRRADRGAFFGSIHATLNHLLWGDRIWMNRFASTGEPTAPDIAGSIDECSTWRELSEARVELDRTIADWTRISPGAGVRTRPTTCWPKTAGRGAVRLTTTAWSASAAFCRRDGDRGSVSGDR